MATLDELTDSTLLYLNGFSVGQDQSTHLTGNIDADDLTLPVADPGVLGRGIAEIGDELVWIDDTNPTGLTAVLPPYGRGFRGTTAASHLAGTRVTNSPLFPRALVKDAINQTIRSVYPDVVAVASTTFTFNPAISTYALPSGAQGILSVTWQSIGPSKEWMPVRRYRVDTVAATSAFPTGATISLYDSIVPGRTVKVVYYGQPTTLDDDDDFSVTGLPASCEDLIRLGAQYRMVPFLDTPHLSGLSAEADFGSNNRQAGSAAQLGRFLLQQYQIRLQEEARRQDALYPQRSYYTR